MITFRSSVLPLAAVGVLACAVAAQTVPAATGSPARYSGEITGNDVYIRSGPSKNYYTVMKLNAGNRVTVLGEESGWLAIAPPAGAFSLIDANYVDRGEGKAGIVNGNNVNVRAGSLMSGQKYAVQLKLKKNAAIEIVEPTDDGFLKIVPPDGAKLWVSRDFVTQIATPPSDEADANATPAATDSTVTQNPPPAVPQDSTTAPPPAADAGAVASANPSPSPVDAPPKPVSSEPSRPPVTPPSQSTDAPRSTSDTAVINWQDARAVPAAAQRPAANDAQPATETAPRPERVTATPPAPEPRAVAASEAKDFKSNRAALEALDAELQAEMLKPLTDRQFAPIIERFRPFTQQNDDELSRAYAQQRVTFMERLASVIASARNVQSLSKTVQSDRDSAQAARDLIPPPRTLNDNGFHAEGQLRTSAVYDSPLGPKRYRLVDPANAIPRTLCYLEFAAESAAGADDYIGRGVGIRAVARRVQIGDVEPVPIYVVGEMRLLDRTVSPSAEHGPTDPESAIDKNLIAMPPRE